METRTSRVTESAEIQCVKAQKSTNLSNSWPHKCHRPMMDQAGSGRLPGWKYVWKRYRGASLKNNIPGPFSLGAKWFLKGVSSPSLRAAPLGKCWYQYIFCVRIHHQILSWLQSKISNMISNWLHLEILLGYDCAFIGGEIETSVSSLPSGKHVRASQIGWSLRSGNPNDLYVWRDPTLQNNALFKQNNGHLGSR